MKGEEVERGRGGGRGSKGGKGRVVVDIIEIEVGIKIR